MLYPTPIAKLIESFTKLPGIGIKTATRLAFYTIGMSDEDVNNFAKNLLAAKRELTYCSVCGNLTDDDPCNICTDESRDRSTGPDDINLKSLLTRLRDNSDIHEVIIATNATADGEATAMYISRVLKPAGITVTRLARGLAVGSDIEYADEVTLLRAIENRTEL